MLEVKTVIEITTKFNEAEADEFNGLTKEEKDEILAQNNASIHDLIMNEFPKNSEVKVTFEIMEAK